MITIVDGTTVEVLNTGAEGRLLLADALCYAKNLNPMLVIDLATLTGAAHAAIGKYGMVGMHSGAGKYMEKLEESGLQVHGRIAEFPFWEGYAELLKSDIAYLKNIGGPFTRGPLRQVNSLNISLITPGFTWILQGLLSWIKRMVTEQLVALPWESGCCLILWADW